MNAAEKRHLDAVAALGCLICRKELCCFTPACIHHIRHGMGMGQRNNHFNVLPLCPTHHQSGGWGIAFHAGSREFQRRYGTEMELLEDVQRLLAMENAS